MADYEETRIAFATALNGIRSAVYGREVREYLYQAFSTVYDYCLESVSQIGTSVEDCRNYAEQAIAAASDAEDSKDAAVEAAEKCEQLVADAVAGYKGGYYRTYDLIIEAANWTALSQTEGSYNYYNDVEVPGCTPEFIPFGNTTLDDYSPAVQAGLASIIETVQGAVRFYAVTMPTEDIKVTVTLLAKGTSTGMPATTEEMGLVRIGDGLVVVAPGEENEGLLSVDMADEAEVAELINEKIPEE